jgi:phospholipid transport system substrate-binding protein
MRMMKAILGVVLFLVGSLLWGQSSPVPMLENSAINIVTTLKDHKPELKQNHKIIYQAVQRYLLPNVDVNGMSRSVLGRQAWSKATTAEKEEFKQVFTELVIRTYANPLAEYTDEQVKFLPYRSQVDAQFARVNSVIIRSNGQNIPLSYSLVCINNQWKIYDLSVEGVSLLQSFRSQFGQALQGSSMHELIAEMRKNSKNRAA